jgi:hypothetical protein
MQHEAELFSQLKEHVRTTGFNDSNGLWQTVLHRQEVESFCPPKELAFTVCCEQFDSETGFRRPTLSGPFDASVMPRSERPAVTFSGKNRITFGGEVWRRFFLLKRSDEENDLACRVVQFPDLYKK